MNQCTPEKGHERVWKDVKTYFSSLRRGGSLPGMGGWKIEGKKRGQRRVSRKEYKRLREKLRLEVSWSQKEQWNIAKKRMLEGGGALLEEDGNQLLECRATHEEHFLSSCL